MFVYIRISYFWEIRNLTKERTSLVPRLIIPLKVDYYAKNVEMNLFLFRTVLHLFVNFVEVVQLKFYLKITLKLSGKFGRISG